MLHQHAEVDFRPLIARDRDGLSGGLAYDDRFWKSRIRKILAHRNFRALSLHRRQLGTDQLPEAECTTTLRMLPKSLVAKTGRRLAAAAAAVRRSEQRNHLRGRLRVLFRVDGRVAALVNGIVGQREVLEFRPDTESIDGGKHEIRRRPALETQPHLTGCQREQVSESIAVGVDARKCRAAVMGNSGVH